MAEIGQETPFYEIFEPSLKSLYHQCVMVMPNLTESVMLLHTTLEIGEELIRMAEQRETTFENSFFKKSVSKNQV